MTRDNDLSESSDLPLTPAEMRDWLLERFRLCFTPDDSALFQATYTQSLASDPAELERHYLDNTRRIVGEALGVADLDEFVCVTEGRLGKSQGDGFHSSGIWNSNDEGKEPALYEPLHLNVCTDGGEVDVLVHPWGIAFMLQIEESELETGVFRFDPILPLGIWTFRERR